MPRGSAHVDILVERYHPLVMEILIHEREEVSMTTLRIAKRDRFTVVDQRTVNDDRLSFRARGILVWLLDKSDGWRVDSEQLAAAAKEGRDAVRTALNELVAAGYIVRIKEQDERRALDLDRPGCMSDQSPTTGNPASGNQASENQHRLFSPTPGNPTPENQALFLRP